MNKKSNTINFDSQKNTVWCKSLPILTRSRQYMYLQKFNTDKNSRKNY